MSGIRVTAVDLETGDTAEQVLEPGNYVIVVADPCYLAGEVHHADGRSILTLRGRRPEFLYTVLVPTGGAT